MLFISKVFLLCRVKMFTWKKKIKEVLKKLLKQKKSRYGVNEKEPEKLIQDRTS